MRHKKNNIASWMSIFRSVRVGMWLKPPNWTTADTIKNHPAHCIGIQTAQNCQGNLALENGQGFFHPNTTILWLCERSPITYSEYPSHPFERFWKAGRRITALDPTSWLPDFISIIPLPQSNHSCLRIAHCWLSRPLKEQKYLGEVLKSWSPITLT